MGELGNVSRPKKLTHLDTILYEIGMLEFCLHKLRQKKWEDQRDEFTFLEAYLVHYRNLAGFFGDHDDLKPRDHQVWSPKKLQDTEVATIQNKGPFKSYWKLISQYLSHCTKSRASRDIDWDVNRMFDEISAPIQNFRRLFPSKPHPIRKTVEFVESHSTATISYYVGGQAAQKYPVRPDDKGESK